MQGYSGPSLNHGLDGKSFLRVGRGVMQFFKSDYVTGFVLHENHFFIRFLAYIFQGRIIHQTVKVWPTVS